MNLVIRPDGTAELDDRESAEVVLATLGDKGVVEISLNTSEDPDAGKMLVGKAHALAHQRDDLNALARLLVVELTTLHFVFNGPVVLTDLDAGTAHLLLELARQT